MDPIEFPASFSDLTVEALTELRTNAVGAARALFTAAGSAPTIAQADEAERLQAGITSIDTEITGRHQAAARLAAVAQFADANAEAPEPPATPVAEPDNNGAEGSDGPTKTDPEGEASSDAVETPPGDGAQPGEPVADGAATQNSGVDNAVTNAQTATVVLNTNAVAGQRPAAPVRQADRFHAAADVPGLGTGQAITFAQIAESLTERFQGFPTPQGTNEEHQFGDDPGALRTFGHATISKNIPQELMIDSRSMSTEQIEEVIARAVDEARLPGGSLVAAGGWCSPSETAYSFFDDGATNEGILSLPEVGAPRGGIRHTPGPDWSDIYALTNFFMNTEAQVIAGTATKPCFTVACPTFTDYRLDAYGYCFQIPFLTEAAYPELIRRYLQGSMLAYQHKLNADKIGRLVTLLGAAEDISAATEPVGTLATTLFGRISLVLDRERTKRRWGMKRAVEAVLPMWVRNAIKTDIILRTGTDFKPPTDQQIDAMFAAINVNVQWVYDWTGQDLGNTAIKYPTTFEMLLYPAGSFVGLTLPVVNLSSVYDAASLATNQYTGAFFEEGYTMIRNGFGGAHLKFSSNVGGLTGAASVTAQV